jgi:hypothetical protein
MVTGSAAGFVPPLRSSATAYETAEIGDNLNSQLQRCGITLAAGKAQQLRDSHHGRFSV